MTSQQQARLLIDSIDPSTGLWFVKLVLPLHV